MATGWPMKVTYANGDVYSASDVNDTNGTINLLGQSVAVTAGKNKIINGAMQVWQRGTTFTTSGAYTADRWVEVNGSNNIVVSRSTDVPASLGFQYSMSRAGIGSNINQRIESANAAQLAGQTVTLSFYYKSTAGADSLGFSFYYVNTPDTFSSFTQIGATQTIATPSTSWTRVTYTYTNISANAANGLALYIFRGSGATSTTLMTGVQLEVGSTATAFQTATGTIQGELAACQRYYVRWGDATQLYSMVSTSGWTTNSTTCAGLLNLPVRLRKEPNAVEYANTLSVQDINLSLYTITAVSLDNATFSGNQIQVNFTSSGMTATRFARVIANNSTSGYLALTAEL
jgi:hypothetical protein